MAQNNPKRNYLGIEQDWERIFKTVRHIDRLNRQGGAKKIIQNVRVIRVDARVAFERLFKNRTVERIYCLFPCPWPKKNHIKHRLFSTDFLKLVNSRLKKNGQVLIVTDHQPYGEWILEQAKQTGFSVKADRVQPQFNTKYERKWREGGQEEFYEICLYKQSHLPVPIKKDVQVQSFKIQNFDPQHFHLKNLTGDVAVIFKDMLYDDRRKRALIYVIVSEGHLIQHFRVAVIYKRKHWVICKAEGQQILPTPGIARALDWVYEAALQSCP